MHGNHWKRENGRFPAQRTVHEQYEETTRQYSKDNILYGKKLREGLKK